MLQIRRPLAALSPDFCVMCRLSSENASHLFLHCPAVSHLRNTLFSVVDGSVLRIFTLSSASILEKTLTPIEMLIGFRGVLSL